MSKARADKGAEMSQKEKKAAERAERLRKQLRDNLQRRKQQTRGRTSDADKET
ncbi:hypothetical protein N9Z87_00475 [Amylibacter sp.]|jgi:hypothetical protein|nr:hypothetical protein [Amylibacter sp.]